MPVPRTLTLVALLWCVASVLATVGTRVPIQPTTLSYTPAMRALVVMLAFGACAIYPVARVALAEGAWSARRVALDAMALGGLFTVVFWPMQLVTYWPRSTGLVVWALVMAWTVAACGIVALALRARKPSSRAAISLACPALLGLGALLDAVGVPDPWPALCGPAVAVLDLTPRSSGATPAVASAVVAWPVMLACVAWAAACRPAGRGFAPAAAGR